MGACGNFNRDAQIPILQCQRNGTTVYRDGSYVSGILLQLSDVINDSSVRWVVYLEPGRESK